MKRKSIYTKAHFGELTFAQMPHIDLQNLYKNSISFFLIFSNRNLGRNFRSRVNMEKTKRYYWIKLKTDNIKI